MRSRACRTQAGRFFGLLARPDSDLFPARRMRSMPRSFQIRPQEPNGVENQKTSEALFMPDDPFLQGVSDGAAARFSGSAPDTAWPRKIPSPEAAVRSRETEARARAAPEGSAPEQPQRRPAAHVSRKTLRGIIPTGRAKETAQRGRSALLCPGAEINSRMVDFHHATGVRNGREPEFPVEFLRIPGAEQKPS